MFSELHQRIPDVRAVREPDRLRSNFINGSEHLRAKFTPGEGDDRHPPQGTVSIQDPK